VKSYINLSIIFVCSVCFADNWQQHWHNGYNHFFSSQHQEAALEFDQAITMMSEKEREKYPYVLVSRAENDRFLHNYSRMMQDTEKALKSENLTAYERLSCGMNRIAALMEWGDEDAAVEEYKKYVTASPLMPKYDYFEEKIVVRNIPESECCKNAVRQFILTTFCENKDDISEYGNIWVVNTTEGCHPCSMNVEQKVLPIPFLQASRRGPDQIQACCNTVNKLAAAAQIICGCISTPVGPVTSMACKAACGIFVEGIRQVGERCCHNGGVEEQCWKKFDTWKIDFKNEYPGCPKPPTRCP
jgi:hypothetical protein